MHIVPLLGHARAEHPVQPRRRWLASLCHGGLLAAAGAPLRTWAQAPDAPAQRLLAARLAHRGMGLVAVEVDGPALRVTAQGLHRAGTPLAPDALFETGSITKTFTALLLADAVVGKRLTLDGAVEDVLGGMKLRDAAGEPLRWVDLATHRSGLPRLPGNLVPKKPDDPYATYRDADLMAFLADWKPAVPRNTRHEYSNLGYALLGQALARAARTSYAELLSARVLRPLGLTDAWLALPAAQAGRLADGHDGDKRPASHWHFDAVAPAGALLMSGATLGRYAQAALGTFDHPLREAFALCLREHAPGATPMNPSGLAWLRAPLNGRVVMNHDGGTFGFASSLWLDPSRQRAAALLSNAQVDVSDLALHLLDRSVPPKDFASTQQAAIAVDAAQLAPLAGSYAVSPQFKLTVSVRDGQLWAQATGQGAFPLFAKSPRRFFARVTPLEIEFDGASGAPGRLTLFQGGNTVPFVREN